MQRSCKINGILASKITEINSIFKRDSQTPFLSIHGGVKSMKPAYRIILQQTDVYRPHVLCTSIFLPKL